MNVIVIGYIFLLSLSCIVNCKYNDENRTVKVLKDDYHENEFPYFYFEDDNEIKNYIDMLIEKEALNEAISQMKLFIDILMNREQQKKDEEKEDTFDHIFHDYDDLIFDDNDNENKTQECSGVGIKMIKHGYFNRCKGKSCFANEIICNNISYTNSTFDQIKDDLTNCTVPSIICDDDKIYNFNKTCTFHKFKCSNSEIYLPNEMDPKRILECQNQISCDDVKYGYEVFDFKCLTDRLECNGEIIDDNSDYKPVDPSCRIVTIPCDDVSINSTCSSLNVTCPDDWTHSVCQKQVNRTSVCPDGYIPLELRSLICGGKEVFYDEKFKGSIHSCESVRSLKFSETIEYLPDDEGTICRIMDLYCDGTYIPFLFNNIPKGCSVGHIFCFNWHKLYEGCTTYYLGCITNQCHYRERVYKCHDNCIQYGLGETCDCPIDYYGSECHYRRPIQCSFNVSNSNLVENCEEKKYSAIYPSCTKMNRSDPFEIEGTLHCWFPSGSIEELNKSVVTNFEYEVIGDNFVLYKEDNWTLMIKVFNFMQYFNLDVSPKLRLDTNQMIGKKLIRLGLNISQLDDQWLIGGKVFTELKFDNKESPTSMEYQAIKTYRIELKDYRPSLQKRRSKVGPILIGIFIPLLILAGIGIVVYLYIQKRKKEGGYQPLSTSDVNEN